MGPLRWHPPHPVNHTDTQYLGDQHWQQCWFFRFFFLFVSICLSMCQSVCLSVHLFTINLKFLKTHNCWLAQLVYVSQVSGLELKKMQTAYQNAWEFFQKIMGEALVPGFGTKQPLQKLKFWLFWFFLFYIKLAGNNEPFRVTPSTSSE